MGVNNMGIYIYKSIYIDAIKIGHYSKANAWSRVAHRGFNSCRCPEQLKGKVNIEDLHLLYWYPSLTMKEEQSLHNRLDEYRICGEWYPSAVIDVITSIIKEENKATECSREAAMNTCRRL